MCVMAVVGEAPCPCFTPAGTTPRRLGEVQLSARPTLGSNRGRKSPPDAGPPGGCAMQFSRRFSSLLILKSDVWGRQTIPPDFLPDSTKFQALRNGNSANSFDLSATQTHMIVAPVFRRAWIHGAVKWGSNGPRILSVISRHLRPCSVLQWREYRNIHAPNSRLREIFHVSTHFQLMGYYVNWYFRILRKV